MDMPDIRRLDFTQLAILASLIRTRKATETAVALNMTQSTVSHALQRMRDLLGDELFIRRPHGLEPTPRALALAPKLAALFDLARDVLAAPRFDPATAAGTLRIGAADYHCALMAAPLIARLGTAAPELRLSFRALIRKAAIDAIRADDIDMAIGLFWNVPASLVEVPLFEETYSLVVARDHPTIRSAPDLATYLAARHIVVSLDGDLTGVVDAALRSRGLARDVVAAVPYFLAALAAVAQSDVVTTLPSRLAAAYAEPFGLRIFAPPLPLRSFPVSALLPAATAGSGLAAWLIAEILPSLA